MPVACAARGCNSKYDPYSGIHFFRFPVNDPIRLELWVTAVGRVGFIPTKSTRLCHKHFKYSDLYGYSCRRSTRSYRLNLKSDAVPSDFQLETHSTSVLSKLFCIRPPKLKKKADNPATALFNISNETFQNMTQNLERTTSRGTTSESTMKKEALLSLDEHISAQTVDMSLNICHRELYRETSSSLPSVGYLQGSKVFNDIQEKQLVDYLKNVADIYFGLGRKELRKLVFEFAVKLKLSVPLNWKKNKEVGKWWLINFLKRNSSISIRLPDSKSASKAMNFNNVNVKHFMDKYQSVLLENKFEEQNIYNLDERRIITVQKIKKEVASCGKKQIGAITSAEHGTLVTMCLAVNAIGDYIPPMFVFPIVNYEGDYVVKGGPPGCVGVANKSGSMQGNEFLKFMKHFAKHVKPSVDKKVLVLLDNDISHLHLPVIDFCREVGIVLLSFPPNCSHILQPLNQSVYGLFQQYINVCITSWITNNPGKRITAYDIPEISSDALTRAALPNNIINGFSISGIWPFNRNGFKANEVAPQ